MKKTTFTAILLLSLLLTACGTQASGTTSGAPGGLDGGMPPADMAGGDPSMIGGIQPANISTSSSTSAVAPAAAAIGVPSAMVNALIQLLESRAG